MIAVLNDLFHIVIAVVIVAGAALYLADRYVLRPLYHLSRIGRRKRRRDEHRDGD